MKKKFSIVGITSFFGLAISVLAGLSIFNKVKVTTPVNAGSLDTYYSSVNGTKTDLLGSVCDAISTPFQSIGYSSLKNHYANTDPRGDGYLYDIYSDNTNYTISSAGSSASSVGGGWNKEHTIPQSWWGGGETGQGCDIIIVRLSDIHCNSVRGNDLFGEVGTNQDTTIDDNKSGLCSNYSEIGVNSSTKVFEPRDAIKGDMARTYFYAAARYWKSGNHNGPVTTWTSGNGGKVFSANGNNGFVQKYLNMLLRWHREDPVDAREVSRNDAVQSTNCQKNRNPFVDHPSWVDLIWGGTYPSTGLNYENTNGGTAEVVNGQISGGSQTPSIAISPTSGSVSIGNTINLTATATGGSGSVTWSITSGSSKVSLSTTTGTSVTVTGLATGSATIQASYSGETATATITVTAQQTLLSIAVQTAPTKTSYTAGQYFDPTGLVITRNYQGGSSDTYTYANHTGDFSFSPSLSTALTTSDTSVTITYGGKSTAQAITVSENSGSGATDSTQFSLITSTSDLEAGKSYIITNGTSGTVKAISVTSNSNNRKTTDVTISNSKITRGSSIMSFTLGGTTGAWTFSTENYEGTDGYLASAASGNNNYLRVINTSTTGTISFSESAAQINLGPHTSRRLIQYNANNGNPIFACYSSSQSAVYLWKEVSSAPAPKTLSSISLDTTNVKKDFIVNETFIYSGLVVTANYSDNTHETVTPTSVSFPNMSTTGNKTVTVTYLTASETYSITVSAQTPTSISASVSKTYYVGDTIVLADITVTDNLDNNIEGFSFANNNYQFTYSDAASGGSLTNKTFTNAISYNNMTCSLTVQVQRKAYVSPQTVADELDLAYTGQSGSTYGTWSSKAAPNSTAYYTGHNAGGNSSIQLRSTATNNTQYTNEYSGIVSTTSGGTITKVTVKWNSNTSSGRVLNVYGKNTAYSSQNDLFNDSSKGIPLGTIVYGTSTELTISGNYAYVGIRSNSGAMYLDKVTFTYGSEQTPENVANYIMYADSNNQCETKFSVAKGYFESLTSADRNTFMTSDDYVISTARTRLNAWAAHEGKSINYIDNDYVISNAKSISALLIKEVNPTVWIVLVISIVGVSSIGAYYFLKRKKAE